ncbi:hypothetical protein [Shewanella nanhaiensis]|uniref:Uncharacterized protein n=1 Tax=Shewanella nanhaiensis TaxID=2864872 RepID=A0ABS7E634_9GAMM|nr:hypothetical protein [Shewanella nanhaiensis]MBW8184606.1 hypothetical protein [Shewanella nanhaiensis]
MSSFNAEVGSQKHSLQASFSTSDAALTSLNVEQLCSSLVANHMDVVNVINAGAIKGLASEALNSR